MGSGDRPGTWDEKSGMGDEMWEGGREKGSGKVDHLPKAFPIFDLPIFWTSLPPKLLLHTRMLLPATVRSVPIQCFSIFLDVSL